MQRLFSILGLLLAVIWLPTTAHCAWEAAGLLADTCPSSCSNNQVSEDACDTVENGGYKLSGLMSQARAPDLFVCLSHFCDQDSQSIAARENALPDRAVFDQPHDWIVTWSFVRRTAPPARAPTTWIA